MKHLVIDAQLFQTPAWHRGMGKYSLEFIKSLAQLNQSSPSWADITVLLSSNGSQDQAILDELNKIAGIEVRMLDLLPSDGSRAKHIATANRVVVTDFIAGFQGGIDFIITSLMQKEIYPVFPTGDHINKAVIFYDLIPLTFHKTYLQDPMARHEYLVKMPELLLADTYLAISKTVANDLTTYLGVAPHRVVTIDGGAIDHDVTVRPIPVKKPFILMPTGNDLRKNNRRGIEGFIRFNKKHNNKYTLVVTSFFTEHEVAELSKLTEHVQFTGNLAGAELKYLYKEAATVLFPSEYEGLGLPVLEALKEGTSVACSDISVFREISKDAFAFFDPKNSGEIALALDKAIAIKLVEADAKKVLAKYNWENTAVLASEMLSRTVTEEPADKTKVVVVAGLGGVSRVSKMIMQAQSEFARRFDASYYQNTPDGIEQRVNFLSYVAKVDAFADNQPILLPAGRLPIYHLENTAEGRFVAFTSLARPGVAVLHDIEMEDAWQAMRDYGLVSERRMLLERSLNEKYESPGWLVSLVLNQKAIIVFTKKAKKIVESVARKVGRTLPVYYVDFPVNVLAYVDVLPTKDGSVATPDQAVTLDDMEYEERLSRVSAVFIDDVTTRSVAVAQEASKYGAEVVAGAGVDDGKTTTYDQVVRDMQKKSYNKESDELLRHDAKRNYGDFAEKIATIVKGIEE